MNKIVKGSMSEKKNDSQTLSSSNPNPSAPPEPPLYADSVGIPIEDGQQPLNAEYLEGLSHSNPLPPYQSKVAAGLYDRTQLYAMPVPPQYDALSQQPAIIQRQPIGQQDYNSPRAPVVDSTDVAIITTCQECTQRRRAKRIRQLRRDEGGECCFCPDNHGSDCSCEDIRAFAIIWLFCCCLEKLWDLLVDACCAEEPEERCSTCGSII